MAKNDDKKLTTAGAGKEHGVSGTLIYSGIISNEEYNRDLVGVLANQKYEIMRRSDSTVRSALQVVKLPILSTTWGIEPPKDEDGNVSDNDQEKADFIRRELMERNVNFHTLIKSALTAFDFGFSVFEKVFELTDFKGKARIGLAKVASRKQVSIYKWEQEDGSPGITQQTSEGKFSIPMPKLVVFTHDKEGENYEGTSLLRYVYKDFDIKDKLTIVNAMSLERQGMGIPVAQERENQTATPEDESKAENVMSNIRANEKSFIKMPSTMTIEMLDMKGQTTKEILPTLNYHDGRIMTGVLARFMELGGASGTGSNSLSSDLSSIFMKAEEAVANEFVATINEHIIKQLCDLNYDDNSTGYPKLTYGNIADDDMRELAESVAALMNAGAITADAELENNMRARLRLPELTKEQIENYDEYKVDVKTSPSQSEPSDSKTAKELDKETKAALVVADRARKRLIDVAARVA